jgi:hypothetical protein
MMAITPPAGGTQDGVAARNVLALNSGSSSPRFRFYRVGASQIETRLASKAERRGASNGRRHVLESSAELPNQ